MFSNKPDMHLHVNYMLKKARSKLWALRNVKRAGMGESDMLKIFNTCIRPTLDYLAPTFHSMLTKEMSEEIERIQKRACKMIFGWNSSYSDLVKNEKIETLSARRERLTLNFAKKAAANPRFNHWFPEKNYSDINIRNQKK